MRVRLTSDPQEENLEFRPSTASRRLVAASPCQERLLRLVSSFLLEIAVEDFAQIDSYRFAVAVKGARVEAGVLDAHGQLRVGGVGGSCETDSAAFGCSTFGAYRVAASLQRASCPRDFCILSVRD